MDLKRMAPLIAILSIVIIGIFINFSEYQINLENVVSIESLELMESDPPSDYFNQLTEIIRDDPDADLREQAIYTLSRIAIRRNETNPAIKILKETVYDEEDDTVRTAAYAAIHYIQQVSPAEKFGTMNLSIRGGIAEGKNITIVTTIASKVDVPKVIVGINRLDPRIDLITQPIIYTSLKGGVPKNIEFIMRINSEDSFEIPITMMLSFNRIESESIKKILIISLNESSGKYGVIEE